MIKVGFDYKLNEKIVFFVNIIGPPPLTTNIFDHPTPMQLILDTTVLRDFKFYVVR